MGECSRLVHQSAGHRVTLFAKLLREREREREGGREEERKRGREKESKRVSATTINKKVTVTKINTIIILNDKMFR